MNQAGIQYEKGTQRPKTEWAKDANGNRTIPTYYTTFSTIEDGLKAQQIIMSQTYGNSTV